MKTFLFVFLCCIWVNLSAQSDTTFYFNQLNRICSPSEADYRVMVKKSGRNTFIQKTQKINKKLERDLEEETRITITSDSTYDVKYKSGYNKTCVFHRTDSGYFITEPDYKTVTKGFSKNLIPIVKSGVWMVYSNDTGRKLAENFYEENELIRNLNWYEDGSPFYSDIFAYVETNPLFKNKDVSEFQSKVLQEVKYPHLAVENGISGKVYLQYVILKDGTLEGVRVLRGVHPELDSEALRALRSVKGKWTPGTIRGNPVNTFLIMPVIFRLQE